MKKKILLIIFVSVLLFSFGCESYVEHDTSFEALVGEWHMNCVYKNAHAIDFTEETLIIKEDKSGEILTPSKGEDGEVIYLSKNVTTAVSTDSEGNAVITVTKDDGTAKDYIYKVDVPAQLMHLYYTNADGDEYHYVYVSSEVEY
ncbi:MAG: hypothetical protein E7218_05295 [Anaerofustis stercorihominis]|nr:hypothetical protein [Anaerofustis stercorihominis]